MDLVSLASPLSPLWLHLTDHVIKEHKECKTYTLLLYTTHGYARVLYMYSNIHMLSLYSTVESQLEKQLSLKILGLEDFKVPLKTYSTLNGLNTTQSVELKWLRWSFLCYVYSTAF